MSHYLNNMFIFFARSNELSFSSLALLANKGNSSHNKMLKLFRQSSWDQSRGRVFENNANTGLDWLQPDWRAQATAERPGTLRRSPSAPRAEDQDLKDWTQTNVRTNSQNEINRRNSSNVVSWPVERENHLIKSNEIWVWYDHKLICDDRRLSSKIIFILN